MARWIVRRIAASVAVLLAVSAAIFFLGRAAAPGNVATTIIGAGGATTQQRLALERKLGLTRPLYDQYGSWLLGVLHGQFGTSPISGRSATSVIAQEAPVSIEIALLALLLATLVGVAVGIAAAVNANGLGDYAVRAVAMTGLSVPVFVVGTLLVLGAAHYAPSLYSASYTSFFADPAANLQAMILPVLTAALPIGALIVQMTRATILEELHQPYMLAATARGISRRRLLGVHALKTALPPLLTFQAFQFGILLGSLFLVEQIFSLPGLGRGIIADIGNRDYVLVEAEAMVIAAAFVLANLLVDLVDPLIDPRKRVA